MDSKKLPFLETIYHLRTIEQVILYNKLMVISKKEEQETLDFLETEYEKEQLNYPYTAPSFNPKAAMWACKTVYFSAQLLLYRENKVSELKTILPNYPHVIDASAILSADICLRFLPQVLIELKKIDTEDAIIPILESHLQTFHYSNIGFDYEIEKITLEPVFADKCLKQMYLDRVVERKAIKEAEIPIVNECLLADFGDYKKLFWRALEIKKEKVEGE
jgi:hypothetical protein